MRIPVVFASLLLLPAALQAAIVPNGNSIAAGKSATSTDETYGPAAHLTDGNLTGGGGGGEWLPNATNVPITVDLGQVYRLSDLNLLNSVNFNDRATGNFNVQISTTGAFAGEQGTVATGVLQAKSLGFQDIALPANISANNQQLVGRYLRVTPTSAVGFGPGLTELLANGSPNTGTGTVYLQTADPNSVRASAYTRTPFLTDAAPASYSLSLVTPTSSTTLQSLGKTVTIGGTLEASSGPGSKITDGINGGTGGGEVLWAGGTNDLSQGYAQVDLGQKILIDHINLLNSQNFNDRGTKDFLIWVSNDPTFADANATQIATGTFSGIGATDTVSLAKPVLGQYVRFIASTGYGFGAGLDELSVFGQTVTTTLLASGTTQLGDSSTLTNLALSSALPNKNNLLSLTVTPSSGWSTSQILSVEIVPEPATLAILTVGALALLGRRKQLV